MNPEKYLQNLLTSQDLLPKQLLDLEAHKKEVTDFLQAKFGELKPEIKYAGSFAKGTMIRERYDLDVVCYFPHTDSRSLKEIREDLARYLATRYVLRPKSSAERILDLKGAQAPSDFHIDVVAGRFIENSKDVFLHIQNGEKDRLMTNLKTHINTIANSGCVSVIRLVKLWAHRNNISLKTFVLELFVIESLRGSRNKDDLKKGFVEVVRAFKDNFASTRIIDPANTNNIVSTTMSNVDEIHAIQIATATYEKITESENISDWKSVFCDYTPSPAILTQALNNAIDPGFQKNESFTPRSQWCEDNDNN